MTQPLSEAQAKIAVLVALGKTNREIAQHLGIAEQTVKNQLHVAYQKTGVRSRTEFIREIFTGRLNPSNQTP